MAAVIRPPDDDTEARTVLEFSLPSYNIENYGCGENDGTGQGIQPLPLVS